MTDPASQTSAQRGLFITFEGIDGSGKTVHAARLVAWLRERGLPVVATCEPGGTPAGERIREVLLDPAGELGPWAETLLYLADRTEHTARVLRPALDAGRIAVSERYADSTVAYQGWGRGLDLDAIARLNEIATGGLAPDLTLLLDVSPREARRRKFGPTLDGADRLERADVEFHERVAQGYRALARAEPGRIALIPAAAPPDRVFGAIVEAVEPRLADWQL